MTTTTTTTTTAAVIGSTGLVGHSILQTLLDLDAYKKVYTISRRAPKTTDPSSKLSAAIETDTSKWTSQLAGLSPLPSIIYSALGTTRAQAGGIANQWKIDHDLNVELAKASHASGIETFVFISSAGTRGFPSSMVPYSKMKNGVEDAIKSLGFKQAIILHPGFLIGHREEQHAVYPVLEGFSRGMRSLLGQRVQDMFAQEGEVVARAAVKAASLAAQGKAPAKYWVLEQSDIVRLGRDEWDL
ncbi:NAD(P)-binding protein [Poronia punctata]|nr:NAD(P)-binding protein [Poronia punctata]